MYRIYCVLGGAAIVLCLCQIVVAETPPPKTPAEKPILVLSVTGLESPAHNWRERGEAIRKVLATEKRFEIHAAEDPEFLASPAIGKYDVVVLHFRNLKPLAQGDAVKRNLAAYVQGGGGLVAAVHGVLGAFPDWPEYVRIVGRIWGPQTSHDPRRAFPVAFSDAQHPITRGMAPFTADDELFSGLKGDTPIHVLATAPSLKVGKDVAIAFTLDYGRGRVFSTTLGHDARAIQMPGTAELLRRACLWAAGRDADIAGQGNAKSDKSPQP